MSSRSFERTLALYRLRAAAVPVASVLAGSAVALLPIVANWPLLPPLGLVMLLAWRLLRAELWPVWIGLPLGFADDLLAGEPIGHGIVIWSACLLVLDPLDHWWRWRDFREEWVVVAAVLGLALVLGLAIAAATGGVHAGALLVQHGIALLAFPIANRLAAGLDRWRRPA